MGVKRSDKDKNLAKKSLGSYLHMNRDWWRISQKKLARGLCYSGMIDEIEKGEKGVKWLLAERILRRIQVESGWYECYLNLRDYTEWKSQEEIITALEQNDAERMAILLKEYAKNDKLEESAWEEGRKESVSKRLQWQFYLTMYGICRKLQNAPREELLEIFSKALQLTIPGYEEEFLCDLVLCAEEINLMLEYAQCLPEVEGIRLCLQIKRYLEDTRMEDITRVLNYPKTILILGRMLLQQERNEEWKYNEILKVTEPAFELMRKTKRIYYLGELMEVIKEAEKQISILKGEDIRKEGTREITERVWKYFPELSVRMGVPTEQTDAYLYRRQDVYYIGDCIRMRRRQKGITQRELCEGICNIETLQALENRRGKKRRSTHPVYIQELCERLGLSPEMIHTELVTSNLEGRKLEREIGYTANKGEFRLNLQQLEKLKTLIDMSEPINQQWVLRTEGLAKYELGEISREKYEEMIKQAWEYTLPLTVLEDLDKQEYYLTNSEMECIYYLSRPYYYLQEPAKAGEMMRGVFDLEKGFEEEGQERVHIRTYELYTVYMAGILHEQGEYEQGKQYAKKVIKLCLEMKRVNILNLALYSWMKSNIKIQNKKTELKEAEYNWKKDLENCLALSQFCKNSENEKFFKRILENINEERN